MCCLSEATATVSLLLCMITARAEMYVELAMIAND